MPQIPLAKEISIMTVREAFNSHDIDDLADTLADVVVFRAPGGMASLPGGF